MRFLVLVFINLRRHWLRAGIGAAGIGIGVAAMMTIVAIVHGAIGMFEHILNLDSQYVVFERNVSDLFFSSVPEADLAALARDPDVQAVQPLLFGLVSAPDAPVITCFGLRADDPRLTRARWLEGTAADFGGRRGEVFLGERAGEFLRAGRGGTVAIGARTFQVGGVLRSENGFEDGGVFLPLAEAQEYFHRPGVASIAAVKLHDAAGGAAFRRRFESAHPGLAVLENSEFGRSYHSFRILRATSWAIGACAFILGGLGVANTMLLSVFGRIREVAILRVNGFSAVQVALLIFGEALVLALAGLVAGGLAGAGLLAVLPHVPQLQGYIQPELGAGMLAILGVLAVVTAIGGALYPAFYAMRIEAADALRYE
ncbi:MAG: ABC transporter permease [Opitutales bacterium]